MQLTMQRLGQGGEAPGLRAARAVDMAEADAIIATIAPLLAPEQNDQPEEANA